MVSNADTASTVAVHLSIQVHYIADTTKNISRRFQTLSKEGAAELFLHQHDGTWNRDSIWKLNKEW